MNYGGDFGASQFAGGGFVPSPAPGGESGYGGQQKFGGSNKQVMQTVREITVRQLLRESAMNGSDDSTKVDGVDLAMFFIMGRIVSRHDTSANLQLRIDDGTGIIEVLHYPDENDLINNASLAWQPNTYVRVCGNMRTLDQKKSMMAFRIKVVTDFNEITYHNLQCIFQHLHLTKGAAPPGSAPQQQGGFGGSRPAGTASVGPGGGYGAAPSGGFGAPAGGSKSGEDKLREDILQTYNSCTAENGLSVQEAMGILRQQGLNYNEGQVRSAVAFLADEGNLYSTIDENHYRSTAM